MWQLRRRPKHPIFPNCINCTNFYQLITIRGRAARSHFLPFLPADCDHSSATLQPLPGFGGKRNPGLRRPEEESAWVHSKRFASRKRGSYGNVTWKCGIKFNYSLSLLLPRVFSDLHFVSCLSSFFFAFSPRSLLALVLAERAILCKRRTFRIQMKESPANDSFTNLSDVRFWRCVRV